MGDPFTLMGDPFTLMGDPFKAAEGVVAVQVYSDHNLHSGSPVG
jgi:hypothetical protein